MPCVVGQRKHSFALRVLALMHPFWTRSDERVVASALLIAIIGLTLALVYLNVQYNFWNRDFFNALEAKDTNAFWVLIPHFFGLSALTVGGTALQAYLTQMLQMRWRVWITREYLGTWLGARSYYHLELDPRGTDNPDQRMSEDLKQLTTNTLDLLLGLLHNIVMLVSFIAILWSVSHAVSFTVLGSSWNLPGDMVWAALLYAVIGSAATYWIGRPLIRLRFQQERLEADMRYSLMRTREHAEGIALYRGERAEASNINERIEGLKRNWREIMRATLKLNGLSSTYTQIGILFPYFLAAPRYFSGQITLGGLTQIAGAFDTVRTSLSWFVFNYQALAIWKASIDRLLTFEAALASVPAGASGDVAPLVSAPGTAITVDALAVALPSGQKLLDGVNLEIKPGERIMLGGAPGVGKSTLFRALGGLWPATAGRISLPAGDRILFLPQKPYLPIGRLADVVAYPGEAHDFEQKRLRAVLERVGLAPLADRLEEKQNWSQVLSGGEQQKVAVARALLAEPDWLFLDEATSALDEASEARLYTVLREDLPSTAVVSISHRPGLSRHHDRQLTLSEGRLAPVPVEATA